MLIFFFFIFFFIFPNVSSISQYLTESNKPDHDNTGIFFVFFPLQKDFDIYLRTFFGVFIFLLQKYFNIFHVLLFEAFLCFLDNIYLPFLYIQKKKNYKKLVISYISVVFNFLHHNFLPQNLLHQNFLHLNFLYQNFIHQNFFIRIRRNFYIINIIMNNLFFFKNIFTFL